MLQYGLDMNRLRGHYEEDISKIMGGKWVPADLSEQGALDFSKPDPGQNFMRDLKSRVQLRIKQLRADLRGGPGNRAR